MKNALLRYDGLPFVLFVALLALLPIMPSCGGGGGGGGGAPPIVYSNATLTGTWLGKFTVGVDTLNNAFKFDGNGNITEDYDLNPGPLPKSYSVQANGSFTILVGSPAVTVTGTLTSATTGVFTPSGTFSGSVKKVMDLGLCQGTWSGKLAGGHTNSFQIIVDNTGTITGGSGFAPSLSGKLFCESGDAVGLLTTGETDELIRIKFYTGTVVTGATVTISGNYETNGPGGTYTLAK
jgi:hypothetical protein